MTVTKREKRLINVAFVMYLAILFWIIALKCNLVQGVTESIYFASQMSLCERFAFYMLKPLVLSDLSDTLINIIIFIPLSLLMSFLIKKHPYILSVVICLLISIFFEIFQIISCIGGFTYIDIINNTLGGVLGALGHFYLIKLVKNRDMYRVYCVIIGILSCIILFATVNTIVHIKIYFPSMWDETIDLANVFHKSI